MALKASPDDQALLLDLQRLDNLVQQLDHRAKNLPEHAQLTALAREEEQLRVQLAQRLGAWEDANAELKRTESDVAVVEARMTRDNSRLQATSSVRDVQALEQELAALKSRLSDLEDIELSVMERVEAAQAELDATRAAMTEIATKRAELEQSRDAALASIDGDRRHAQANRSTVAGRVPADLLALYEKQRARYGVGASLLRGGMSTASGVALNASDMNAVRAAAPDDVLLCPDSSAILIRTAESGL